MNSTAVSSQIHHGGIFFVLARWKVAFVLMRRLRFLIQLFYWQFIGVFYCIMFEMLKNYLRKNDFY